jgi:tetratricopeptide (TPR) repeat protein
MVAVAIATGLITLYVERHSGGATGAEYAVPFVDRVLISGRSFWFYLGKFLLPYPLIFIYDRWTVDARQAVQWLYPAAAVAFLSLLYAGRHRIGKGVFVAAVHFYLGTSALIVIVVLYMTRFSYVSDHWQYFGMWSAAAIAGAGAASLLSRAGKTRRAAAIAAVAFGVSLLGAATRHQTAQYRNRELLYRATLARNPRCWMASYNLAVALIGSGRHDEARALLDETLRLKPDNAEAHLDLGNELLAAGEPEAAIVHLNEAKRLVPAYTAKAEFNIADGLSGRGDLAGTIEHLRAAVQFDPRFAEAQSNLGYALALNGRFAEAIEHDRQALSIRPDFPEARANLEAARAALHKSCLAAMGAGRTDEAIGCFRQELAIDPNVAEVHNDLGVALAGANQLAEALDQFREAVRLAPESKSARENLERASAAASIRR